MQSRREISNATLSGTIEDCSYQFVSIMLNFENFLGWVTETLTVDDIAGYQIVDISYEVTDPQRHIAAMCRR